MVKSLALVSGLWFVAQVRMACGLMDRKSLTDESKSQLQVLGDSDNDGKGIVLQWMGCFNDDEKHDLEWNPTGKFTMSGCMQECLFTRYSFMALQDGDQCWCANEYKTDFQYYQLPDSECESTCFGGAAPEGASFGALGTKRCGGKRANAIYKLQMRIEQAASTTASTVTATTATLTSVTATSVTATTTTLTLPHDDENKARLSAVDVCEDKPTTNFSLAGRHAVCSEIKHYCTDANYTKDMEAACPVTCGLCRPSWVGCFHDDDHEHDFSVNPPGKHTTKSCMTACSGFLYMGLQGGSQCWCGMKYSSNQKTYYQMIDTDCGDVCHGEGDLAPARYCGKTNVNAVYRLPAIAPNAMPAAPEDRKKPEGTDEVRLPITSKPMSIKAHIKTFAGCFTERNDGAGAVFLTQPKGTHTTETCLAECTKYKYMALEDMGTCWCGSMDPAATPALASAPEDQCGDVCHGEAGLAPVRYCGGKRVNAIYELEVPVVTGINKLVDSEAHAAAAEAASEPVLPVAAPTAEVAAMSTNATTPANATGNATAAEPDVMDSLEVKVYTNFLQFDADQDGVVNEQELSVLAVASPTQWSEQRVHTLFVLGDQDNDGKLQYWEFKQLVGDNEDALTMFSTGPAPSN